MDRRLLLSLGLLPLAPRALGRFAHPAAAAAALAAGAAAGIGWPRPAHGATVLEGVTFEERITLGGRELVFNGAGLRAAGGWFKVYVAALYLGSRTTDDEQAVAQPGPKRVRVVLLREAPGDEFAKAVDKGILKNVPLAAQEAMRPRMAQLTDQMRAVGKVKAGDVVDLDHEPARGTVMLLNGKPRGPAVPGADFYAALLRSFIGQHPYHRDLRAGMLGLPVPAPKT